MDITWSIFTPILQALELVFKHNQVQAFRSNHIAFYFQWLGRHWLMTIFKVIIIFYIDKQKALHTPRQIAMHSDIILYCMIWCSIMQSIQDIKIRVICKAKQSYGWYCQGISIIGISSFLISVQTTTGHIGTTSRKYIVYIEYLNRNNFHPLYRNNMLSNNSLLHKEKVESENCLGHIAWCR